MFKYICIYNIVHIFEYMRGNKCTRYVRLYYIYPHIYTHRYIYINMSTLILYIYIYIYIYIYNFSKCDIICNYISVSILILNNKIIIGIYRYL